jgi:transposase InsO family protein
MITRLLASVFEPGRSGRPAPESLYGAVKAWGWLRRQEISVARCTVERIMRANGWRGNVRRARKVRTTVSSPVAERFPDLVRRQFRADAPGRLLVADFTYSAQPLVMRSLPARDAAGRFVCAGRSWGVSSLAPLLVAWYCT